MNMQQKSRYIASFMVGVGSILNIAPAFTIVQVGTPQDDARNLKNDWQRVGSYLSNAMSTLDNERANTKR